MTLRLTSPAFANGAGIPSRFTCDGDNWSPILTWSGAPSATRSFAIICRDPDAPSGVWYHWAAFDIASDIDHLAEHCMPSDTTFRQGVNDFGKRGYGGPCPPRGHGMHHYHFTLYALDARQLGLPATAHCHEIDTAARAHALAIAELVGVYAR